MPSKKANINEQDDATLASAEVADAADVQEERKPVVKKLDPHQIVVVRNGFQGKLVYRSKRTGEPFVWDGFNDEQEMELSELKSAKGSDKRYFINNWFMFDDPEIIECLGVSQYYKFALKVGEFDKLFEKSVAEIRDVISKLSPGQKKSVAYRAKQMVATGEIDSNKTIATLAECLGVELVERQGA